MLLLGGVGVPVHVQVRLQVAGLDQVLGGGRVRLMEAPELEFLIEDKSVYPSERETSSGLSTIPNVPSILSFTSMNTVILKDGQSMQYTTATDKVTGEVTKVDVSLTVLK